MQIKLNYQSSLNIDDSIFFDPIKIKEGKAKYIFLTHPHYDHFSVEDMKKISAAETKIICPKSMEKDVAKHFVNKVIAVEPNNTYNVDDLTFSTFPCYNTNKKFHLKEYGWVGYVLLYDGKRIAVVGDSDDTDELENLKADILLLPIGGTFTMTVEEAAKVTNIISPEIVIPIHYGDIVGTRSDATRFAKLLNKNIQCKILRD